jgi:2'-5' RNA ligase
MTRRVSYWLVPAAPERAFFQGLIETLAATHQAPTFVPHVTVYTGESPADERPVEIIARAASDVPDVRLEVDRVLYTAAFTKTLFVQFHPSSVLDRMAEEMRRLSARPSDYLLDPHLSLIYKRMSEQEQQRLAATVQLPMANVRFDEIWANVSLGATRTAEDVRRWEVVCRHRLSPAT